ncbi:GNAT family N-acetyltransferase [candidate division WOR-3 bacterium]|nr:GNAT family N-acetyltransferase [candidate division WOR-3 bacterium]
MYTLIVSARNVHELGFFCKMSQPRNPGYLRKLAWLEKRFAEGLVIRLLDQSQGGRGFIEYLPGEYAWRPVHAAGYMFIHCLWVVGSSKGKGYASRLLTECIADAKRRRMKGVAMLTRKGNWLLSPGFLSRHGFETAARAEPDFELMALRFRKDPLPSLPSDWEARAKRFGTGLTIVRTDQCPYLDDGVNHALRVAQARGLKARVVDLRRAAEVRLRAPSPYGVFGLVLDGRLLSHHYRLDKELAALLDSRGR